MGGDLDVYRATADELESEIRRVFEPARAERVLARRDRRAAAARPARSTRSRTRFTALSNAALRAAGIPLTYETLDVHPDALASTMALLASNGSRAMSRSPTRARLRTVCTALATGGACAR